MFDCIVGGPAAVAVGCIGFQDLGHRLLVLLLQLLVLLLLVPGGGAGGLLRWKY